VGILAAAFWDGGAQLMLTLTPQKNRNAYLAWHMAAVGLIAAGGSKLGGWLSDALAGFHCELWTGFSMGAFHVVVLASFVLTILSVLVLLRIREGREKPVGYVISRVFTPGIFRSFANLATITAPTDPKHAARALRTMDGASSHLAVAEMVSRLKDPDLEVREEAARALGRIGTPDPKAVEALVEQLGDPASTIRSDAAYALGRIGDPRAVPTLVEAMKSGSEDLQDACARALEMIRQPWHSTHNLRALRTVEADSRDMTVAQIVPRLDHPEQEVREEAARALGRTGSPEAFDALVAHLRNVESTIRPDTARALGRLGDLRAIPALVECIRTAPEELQDACARALGDIGGRVSVRHLLRLLGENRPERVIAASAEAVSKLGVLEAAWEILPRMHDTRNPVLRGQLAVAMGNILGGPGRFYYVLTGETSQQGSRLGKLVRGARQAIGSIRRALPRKSRQRQALDALEKDLDRIRALMESQQFREAIGGLHDLIRQLVLVVIDRDCSDEMALEYALARDAEFGLGFWFIREVRQRMTDATDPALLHIDALLALYFLSTYRLPPPGQA
jgi:HEAT repeat protein